MMTVRVGLDLDPTDHAAAPVGLSGGEGRVRDKSQDLEDARRYDGSGGEVEEEREDERVVERGGSYEGERVGGEEAARGGGVSLVAASSSFLLPPFACLADLFSFRC